MKCLVVISNYRVADLTIDCLHSVAGEVTRVRGLQVAVCENGSGDNSTERLQKAIIDNGWQSWCTLTAISPNRGFTGGNNVILRAALQLADSPQYFILLNSDTIVRPTAFKALIDFMDAHPDVGIASPQLENPDGTPQCAVFRFHSPLSEFENSLKLGLVTRLLRRWRVPRPIPTVSCEANWVSGASMIVRREVFQEIGVLDDGYFTYYEDIDLCFNARKAGWLIWLVRDSRVMHLAGQSTGVSETSKKRQPGYSFDARRRYFLKNFGPIYAALADAALIAGLALSRLRMLLGKPSTMPPHFLGDNIRHSVFFSGFKLRDVQNPALAPKQTGPEPSANALSTTEAQRD